MAFRRLLRLRLRRRRALAVSGVLAVALAAPALARAEPFVPGVVLDEARKNPDRVYGVIVVAEPGLDVDRLRRELNEGAEDRVKVRRVYRVIEALAAEVTGADLVRLATQDGIRTITPDGRIYDRGKKPKPGLPSSGTGSAIGSQAGSAGSQGSGSSPGSTSGTSGSGTPSPGTSSGSSSSSSSGSRQAPFSWLDAVKAGTPLDSAPTIAIVDSGVDPLPDFGGRLVLRRNYSSRGDEDASPRKDDYGHGTLVAGFAAGGSPTYPGVSPTSKLVSLRVLDPRGSSLVSDLLAAVDFIHVNGRAAAIRVANFSVQSAFPNYGLRDPLNLAIERLWHSGVVVVAAAGNAGSERIVYAPASSPWVITVGASDFKGDADPSNDTNAPWSSYGYTAEGFAKPEVCAPGRYMVGPQSPDTLLARTFPERAVAPGYMWMSGTSFAAPVVAGAAAQLLAAHPDWTPDQVKGALMATARRLPQARSKSCGLGMIDIAAAARLTSPPDGNVILKQFLSPHPTEGYPMFDVEKFDETVASNPNWAKASWSSASWSSASWSSASWSSASWSSASWSSASWSNCTVD